MTLPSFVTWNICGVGTQAETQSARHINKLKAYIVYIYCKLTLRYKKKKPLTLSSLLILILDKEG